jgi:hypothetical protein
MHTKFHSENFMGKDHMTDPGIDRRKIFIREMGWEDVDWIHLL